MLGKSKMAEGPSINGISPSLEGLICDGAILEEYWYRGELAEPATAIHLRFGNQWHHMCIDAACIFWRSDTECPESWSAPEEGFETRLIDLGIQLDLNGASIDKYMSESIPGGSAVRFYFNNMVLK